MNRGGRIREILERPAPCDTCQHAKRCKAESLACTVFSAYINNTGGRRGVAPERKPSRHWYEKVFSGEDDLLCAG